MYPIRGQVLRIKAEECDEAIIDDEGPNNLALVIPRVNDIILGGTPQMGNWNIRIDPMDTEKF